MSIKRIIGLLIAMSTSIGLVAAQANSCPQIVTQALEQVNNMCSGIARNEVCYGNDLVSAQDFEQQALEAFDQVGDNTDIRTIATLSTTAFDADSNTWGIAIMTLQADLPDTLAGQNVTFVILGDTELTNEIRPDAPIRSQISATSTGNINVRAVTSANSALVGTLSTGEIVTAIARNQRGDWLQIEFEDGHAWVFASLLTTEDDPLDLPIVGNTDADYSAPMQVFSLSTGIGQVACNEVSPSGVLIQAPTETTVHFLVNGIEVEIGSTAFIQSDGNQVFVYNLDGNVSVTVGDTTVMVDVGTVVNASENQMPSNPLPYDFSDMNYLPVSLLPETVAVPLFVSANSDWVDSGVMIEAGTMYRLVTAGLANYWVNCEAEKMGVGQPTIDCSSLIFGPAGGDPTTLDGAILGSDMSIFPVAIAPPHSLVGRIGDETFFVGDGGIFTATATGILEFRVNDVDTNNFGGFLVGILPIGE